MPPVDVTFVSAVPSLVAAVPELQAALDEHVRDNLPARRTYDASPRAAWSRHCAVVCPVCSRHDRSAASAISSSSCSTVLRFGFFAAGFFAGEVFGVERFVVRGFAAGVVVAAVVGAAAVEVGGIVVGAAVVVGAVVVTDGTFAAAGAGVGSAVHAVRPNRNSSSVIALDLMSATSTASPVV